MKKKKFKMDIYSASIIVLIMIILAIFLFALLNRSSIFYQSTKDNSNVEKNTEKGQGKRNAYIDKEEEKNIRYNYYIASCKAILLEEFFEYLEQQDIKYSVKFVDVEKETHALIQIEQNNSVFEVELKKDKQDNEKYKLEAVSGTLDGKTLSALEAGKYLCSFYPSTFTYLDGTFVSQGIDHLTDITFYKDMTCKMEDSNFFTGRERYKECSYTIKEKAETNPKEYLINVTVNTYDPVITAQKSEVEYDENIYYSYKNFSFDMITEEESNPTTPKKLLPSEESKSYFHEITHLLTGDECLAWQKPKTDE